MVGTIDDIIAIRLDGEGPNDDRIAFFIIVIIAELIHISINNMTPCFLGEINENPDPTPFFSHRSPYCQTYQLQRSRRTTYKFSIYNDLFLVRRVINGNPNRIQT